MGKHRAPLALPSPGRIAAGTVSAAVVLTLVVAWGLTNRAGGPQPRPQAAQTAQTTQPVADETQAPVLGPPASPRIGVRPPQLSPSPSPSPSPAPSSLLPSPSRQPSARAAVSASVTTVRTWGDGFQVWLGLTNHSRDPQLAKVVLRFPAGVELRDPPECWWNITCGQHGRTVTVTTVTPLEPGEQRYVGFNAVRDPDPAPYQACSCTVNGNPCEDF